MTDCVKMWYEQKSGAQDAAKTQYAQDANLYNSGLKTWNLLSFVVFISWYQYCSFLFFHCSFSSFQSFGGGGGFGGGFGGGGQFCCILISTQESLMCKTINLSF